MNLAKQMLEFFRRPITWGNHTSARRKYTGEELRAIRARNGVGHVRINQFHGYTYYPAHDASERMGTKWQIMCPNYKEWLRKPKRAR